METNNKVINLPHLLQSVLFVNGQLNYQKADVILHFKFSHKYSLAIWHL